MNQKMPNLATPDTCTGCTSCASACPRSCITMTADSFGFSTPIIDVDKCIGCLECQNSCPIVSSGELPIQSTAEYAARSCKNEIRRTSSSGGVFSELAACVIQQGGVVWGARYDDSFKVIHACAAAISELEAFRGAKYAQSDLSGVFPAVREQLRQNKPVLFSGLPCQIAGLKRFLKEDDQNLYCIDCVCHSVPSPHAWKRYLSYRSEQDGNGMQPISVNLRSKETGWSRYQYSVQIRFPQSVYSALSKDDIYLKLFTSGGISRKACSQCRFKGFDRCSDITLGDCWGIWDFAPELDDDKGMSLLLIHSEKGRRLFSSIKDQCVSREITPEQASKCNPAILYSHKQHPLRDRILSDIVDKGEFQKAERELRRSNIKKKTKNTIRKIMSWF